MADSYITKALITTTSNLHGVGGTNVQLDLDIDLVSVEEKQDNKQIIIERPRGRTTQPVNIPVVWVIDLKRIRKIFILRGNLTNGDGSNITGTSPALANTALNKKYVLLAMQEQCGVVTFRYDGTNYTCAITGIELKDINLEKSQTALAGEALYDFTINLTKADLR